MPYPSRASFVQCLVCTVYVKIKDSKIAQKASLGEEGADLCASHAFFCLFCMCCFLSFFSSSWCLGLAAVCKCGTPWTFVKVQKVF